MPELMPSEVRVYLLLNTTLEAPDIERIVHSALQPTLLSDGRISMQLPLSDYSLFMTHLKPTKDVL